jgi:hypothetical protein
MRSEVGEQEGDEMDDEMLAWLQEAYKVGCQEHLMKD